MDKKTEIIFQISEGVEVTSDGVIQVKTKSGEVKYFMSISDLGNGTCTDELVKEIQRRVSRMQSEPNLSLPGDKKNILPNGFSELTIKNNYAEFTNCRFVINKAGEGMAYDREIGNWVPITGCDVPSLHCVSKTNTYGDVDLCVDKNGVIVNDRGQVIPDVHEKTLKKLYLYYSYDTQTGVLLLREEALSGIKVTQEDAKNFAQCQLGDGYWYVHSDPTKIVYFRKVLPIHRDDAEVTKIPFNYIPDRGIIHEGVYLIDKKSGKMYFEGQEVADFRKVMTPVADTKHCIMNGKLIFFGHTSPQDIILDGEGATDFQDIGHGFFRNATNTVLFRGDHIITNMDVPSFTPLGDKTGYDLHGRVLLGPNSFLQIDSLSSLFQYPFFRNMFLDKDDNTLATTVLQLVALKKLVPSFTFCPKAKTTTTEV